MEMSDLRLAVMTDADGVAAQVTDKQTGFYDELILQIEVIDKFGKSHSQFKYVNNKHRLIRLKVSLDELPKVK